MILSPLLIRTSLRYLLRHPWQIGLCVLGVALGVAVVVSIDLANASAKSAFTLSTESVAGRATHQIVGGPSGLDEQVYRKLRVDLGVRESAPLVEGYATLCKQMTCADGGDLTLHVIGVDPFAEGPFRSYLAGAAFDSPASQGNLTALLTDPGTVLLSDQTARRYNIAAGSTVGLRVGGERKQVRVVGIVQGSDDISQRALETLLITDISTGQELLGMVGRLSQVDLILPDDAAAARVQAALPRGAELTKPANRSGAIEQMTRAFELNLSALSLLALIVGMFLIYNTITFSVVQRRGLLGTLRCIGVTQRQIFVLVMAEALLISLVGSALGLVLGVALGRGLVNLVTRTINDLYFVVTVRGLDLQPWVLLKGLALGVGATLAAAMVPALEAMLTAPRSVLRPQQRRGALPARCSTRGAGWRGAAGGCRSVAGNPK